MKLDRTILAGLNLSVLDQKVIAFSKMVKAVVEPENIIFYHVIQPESDNLDASNAGSIKVKLQKDVESEFGSPLSGAETFVVETGDAQKLLLEKSKDPNIDLMVLGRKISERNKILTKDLINAAETSLLLIPEPAQVKISNIVIGINFSEESQQGLDAAVNIARHSGAEIHCVNIYHVPSGYHTSGKSYEEYADIMKQNAIKDSETFMKKYSYDIPLNFEFLLDDDRDPADKLYEYAKNTQADLICLGSKGMDSFAGLFFNTTTEKIVEFSNHIPMLIIKEKGKSRNLIDIFRKL